MKELGTGGVKGIHMGPKRTSTEARETGNCMLVGALLSGWLFP
jgi:hypothetical protein